METAESVARPPSRSSLFDLAVLCLAGFVLRLLLSLGLRLHATNPSAVMAAIACGLGAAAPAGTGVTMRLPVVGAPVVLDGVQATRDRKSVV